MLTYSLSFLGMTVSLHYCCGKLAGISFSGKQENTCKMGSHSQECGCCNDKQVSASLVAEQQAANKWFHYAKQPITSSASQALNTSFKNYIVSFDRFAGGISAFIHSIPLFLKNCVFRI
jgi:hypothetical protein